MPATVRQLLKDVVQFELMTGDEVRTFMAASGVRPELLEAEALASALVEAGHLTAYQAEALAAGKTDRIVFGRYVIQEKIGAGGMGEVFKAVHRHMERTVALKLIAPKSESSADAASRFRREVKIASRLSHPNIVTAYDADEHAGVQYLVMEFVDGLSLSALIRERGPFPVAGTLDIILQAARGLGYAHGEGLIHRDIKPGNVLLDRRGNVKILDLGLARAVDELHGDKSNEPDGLTHSGQVLGTCHYMAPEQAQAAHLADQRSDIYSLGCTLYCLLTARTPFGGDSLVESIIAHREQPVPSLASVRADVSAELDRTFRRMLAKHPAERQQSMAEVIAELERCRAATTQPNPSSVHALSSTSSPSSALALELPPSEEASSTNADVALQHDTMPSLVGVLLTDDSPPGPRPNRRPNSRRAIAAISLSGLAIAALAIGLAVYFNRPPRESVPVLQPVPSALAASDQGWINILETIDPKLDALSGNWRLEGSSLSAEGGGLNRIELPFHPAGSYELRTRFHRPGSGEFNVVLPVDDVFTRIWLTGQPAAVHGDIELSPTAKTFPPPATSFALDPEDVHELLISVLYRHSGVAIAAEVDGRDCVSWRGKPTELALAKAWELSTSGWIGIGAEGAIQIDRLEVRLVEGPPRPIADFAHEDVAAAVAFSPTGEVLASAGFDKVVRLWDLSKEETAGVLEGHTGSVTAVAADPAGDWLASGSADGSVRLWDPRKNSLREVVGEHDQPVLSVAVHPTQDLLATSGQNHAVKLWDLDAKGDPRVLTGHRDWVTAVRFSPSGDLLVSASWDGSVRLWEPPSGRQSLVLGNSQDKFESVAISANGKLVAAGTQAGRLRLWTVPGGQEIDTGKAPFRAINSLAFSPQGEFLVGGCGDGAVRIWNPQSGQPIGKFTAHDSAILGLAFSSEGLLATCGEDKAVRVWESTTLPTVARQATELPATP